MALKSDSTAGCRESSYLFVRVGLVVTGPENGGLVGCGFAVKAGLLKSTNSPFLDNEAPRGLPACLYLGTCSKAEE